MTNILLRQKVILTLDKAYTDKKLMQNIGREAYLDGKKAYLENLKTDVLVA